MRCILGCCFILAVTTFARADETTLLAQQGVPQPPPVSTSVPNMQATGAAAVTSPTTTTQPGMAPVTNYYGNSVPSQPGTMPAPAGNMTYYYYPTENGGTRFYRTTPRGTYYYYSTGFTPYYTTPNQVYYTTVRSGPFGLFRRRIVQPMMPAYTTAATTPTYYTSPSYYYTPTTYYTVPPGMTAPAGTATAAPVYTPTTYTVPNQAVPAASTTPSGTTTATGTTAPAETNSSSVKIPSRSIPAPPVVNPR